MGADCHHSGSIVGVKLSGDALRRKIMQDFQEPAILVGNIASSSLDRISSSISRRMNIGTTSTQRESNGSMQLPGTAAPGHTQSIISSSSGGSEMRELGWPMVVAKKREFIAPQH